ncbi:galactokinase [Virgibacillus halophilus]|uniref:galactokinase n=1 Tax=Tigheibacillus halophilus TaxID=361280 RepID=UPI0036406074
MKKDLVQDFQRVFDTNEGPMRFFAPGRINLIGEHTDYNGGYVFPAAISFGTYALAVKRKDRYFRFYSANFPEIGIITSELEDMDYCKQDDWANYPKGMIKYIREAGYEISGGADIFFYGDIPNGAGLSSSASIEMATGVLLENVFGLDIERLEMIKLGQQVENEYIGVNSGIMDQFAIGMGKKDQAMLLDCQTLDYQYAPIKLDRYSIIIINTNKQRTLAGSKYNERRRECDEALSNLQAELPIQSLGELSVSQFEQYQHLIDNEISRLRARHAVTENERTKQAVRKLQAGDLAGFGQLMNQSHASLEQDYEVTGKELDTIVHTAWKQPGVIGARMTGAGFGGCAIAIVADDQIAEFKQQVNQVYKDTIGYDATFYTAAIHDGAKKL